MEIPHQKWSGGAVLTYLSSPTRLVLVRDKLFNPPCWKLPGGGIDRDDRDSLDAARRELREETGVDAAREGFELHTIKPLASGVFQYIYAARVSEKTLDTRRAVGDEDGRPLEVRAFALNEVLSLPDLLEHHREFIREFIRDIIEQ